MKRCSKCKTITTQFRVADTICKPCRNAYALANKDKAKERNRKYQAKQKQKRSWRDVSLEQQRKITAYAKKFVTTWKFPYLEHEIIQVILEHEMHGKLNRRWDGVALDFIKKLHGRGKKDASGKRKIIDPLLLSESLDNHRNISSKPSNEATSQANDIFDLLTELYPDRNDLSRIAFMLHFKYGLDQEEIAQLYGVTISRICQMVKEALGKLKLRIKNDI